MESVRSVYNTVQSSVSTSESTSCNMIHYMPSIAILDPRLQDCYKGTRTPNAPKYGLGYVEQCDTVIPECRFSNSLPHNMKRPAIEEIMKYLTIIHGCPKNQFPDEWIKKMTNWDLFTNPEANEFHISTPSHTKQKLASDWKEYMQKNECWLSFYSWKKSSQSLASQVIGEPSDTPSHKWKTVDGTEIESKTTFPPFKSLVLESDSATAKAIPLLIDTGNQLSGIEKRVQNVSEQVN